MCPWCALALAVFWLCPWYTAICHRTVAKPLMLLYECKMLLVSSTCFLRTDEWTLVLDYWVSPFSLCIPLVVCRSEIIASDSSSNLIHHACIISYLYRIYLLLKFLLTCFNIAFCSCGYFNLPIVRSQRQLILKPYTCAYLYPCSWAHFQDNFQELSCPWSLNN